MAGVALAMVGLLAGCSVPSPYGLRLNADGTVDAVDCYGLGSNFTVDYRLADEPWDTDTFEWELLIGPEAGHGDDPAVVRYGVAPDGGTTTLLEDPPADWVEVWTSAGSARREELVEGEWVWWSTSRYPWEPERPCAGVSADELKL